MYLIILIPNGYYASFSPLLNVLVTVSSQYEKGAVRVQIDAMHRG